jgi:hypothetical protein
MKNLTDEQMNELRKGFGIEEEVTDIDRSILTSAKGGFKEESKTDKCDEDYSMLEKKLEELRAAYRQNL